MKKIFFITVTAILTMTFLASCEKEKEDLKDSLTGSIWSGSDNYSGIIEINFSTKTNCILSYYKAGDTDPDDTYNGTYPYSYPNVNMSFSDYGDIMRIDGVISSNKMTITIEEDDDSYYSISLTKK